MALTSDGSSGTTGLQTRTDEIVNRFRGALLDGEDWWERLNPLIASADAQLDEGSHHIPIGSNEDTEWPLAKFCQTYCASDMKVERFESWWVKSGRAPMWDLDVVLTPQ